MIDRSRTKNEIAAQLVQLVADHGQILSTSRADKLANRFKKGLVDPELKSILSYADPTARAAIRNMCADGTAPVAPTGTHH